MPLSKFLKKLLREQREYEEWDMALLEACLDEVGFWRGLWCYILCHIYIELKSIRGGG